MADRDLGAPSGDLDVPPDELDPTTGFDVSANGIGSSAGDDVDVLPAVPTLRADLLTPMVVAAPGEPVTVEVQILNTTSVIETIDVSLLGLIPEELTLTPAALTLFPDESQQIELTFTFHATLPTGIHEGVVVVAGSSPGNVPNELPLVVEVKPAPALALSVEPELRIGGKKASFETLVENTGNTPLAVQVRASDANRHLTLYVNRPSVRLGVDQFVPLTLLARGKRPWTGAPVEHVITITAEHDATIATQEVRFRQKARLTAGVITILTLLMIITLWAAAMYFGVQAALQPEAPRKVVAESFAEGTGLDSLDPAVVGGTIGGTISAVSTAEPLPRVTIEAFDLQGELVSATATGDDGSYELAGLLPSGYRLRIRAEGFRTVWWPAEPVPEAAELITVAPNGAAGDVDVALSGLAGVLGGQAVLGDGEAVAVSVEVVAIDLIDEATPQAAEVDEFGVWGLTGLATPATYRVTLSAPGYAPVEITQKLAGGEQLVVSPTRLAAALGAVSGTVTDRSGNVLGGVAITARRGDTELTTVTPTSGEIGAYTLTDLETPGTYLITFELEGFAAETVAIRLGPGETVDGFGVELALATGEVIGNVFDSGGRDLGGVTVSVSGGGVTVAADTFTSGDVGSYRVSGLPLPGTYTVTFELDGYGRETQQVFLDRDNVVGVVNASLRRSLGRISGQVLDPSGQPLAGVTVAASDGDVVRETTTASAPAAQLGRFSFADLPPGTYTVTATRPSGDTQTLLQTVEAAVTSEVVLTVGAS